jgi:flagellin-like protein
MYNPCLVKDREGVSPVIAVILLVAITVVLVATLYFVVSGLVEETQDTPKAALIFEESDDIDGKFTGGIREITQKVLTEDVSLTMVDGETGDAAIIEPLVDGATAQIGSPGVGINITYYDLGTKGQLDGSDIFVIYKGTLGDKITLTYIPTDDILGYYLLFT